MNAVLARVERRTPDGRYAGAGPYHIVNGASLEAGFGDPVRAWCGALLKAPGSVHVLQDRPRSGACWARWCRRCFIGPGGAPRAV